MIPIEKVLEAIDVALALYHRLVLVVGPAGSGKTRVLQTVSRKTGAPIINVNLELSRRMLDLTARQRALALRDILRKVVDEVPGDVVLFDNMEILFDVSLQQNPLQLLRRLSRSRTVVGAWSGVVAEGHLTYAEPGHPEWRRYPLEDVLVVQTESE
ncbi:BREX-3 system P-loop-containing protein BrxF [Deferrisoma palaeochoriense]